MAQTSSKTADRYRVSPVQPSPFTYYTVPPPPLPSLPSAARPCNPTIPSHPITHHHPSPPTHEIPTNRTQTPSTHIASHRIASYSHLPPLGAPDEPADRKERAALTGQTVSLPAYLPVSLRLKVCAFYFVHTYVEKPSQPLTRTEDDGWMGESGINLSRPGPHYPPSASLLHVHATRWVDGWMIDTHTRVHFH